MTSPFPKQLTEMVRKRIERSDIFFGKEESFYKRAYDTAVHGRDFFSYGFSGCLYTGNFAPYQHEMELDGYKGFNCTTVIPSLYTFCDLFELQPRIVQFINFRDIKKTKEAQKKPEPLSSSHYGIIVKVKGQDYFVDPYHSRFGKIKEFTGTYMEVGKSRSTKAVRREFQQIIPYTPEQFVEMMDHLRTPEGSLEMLIAGQEIKKGGYYGGFRDCKIMLHYFDDVNEVRVRLEIPQPHMQDKVVYNHMFFDDDGNLTGQATELLVSELVHWDDLLDPTSIAKGTLPFMKSIDTLLKDKIDLKKSPRLGPFFMQPDNQGLFGMIEQEMLTDFTQRTPGSEALIRMILARTLYETEAPEKEYLFDEGARTADLRKKLEQWRVMGAKFVTHPDEVERLDISVGLFNPDKEYKRRNRRITRARSRRHRKIDENFGDDLNLRGVSREKHDRVMDMILYAKQLGNISVDELNARVKERNVNPSFGYLAMVADFLPSILEAEKLLTLEPFMDDIKAKIKARRAFLKK
ncbi:hypothetical protein HOH15_01135 [Candidatus Woesearchaeota archaeon]|nr:hypothetical protein [Candidatus Woesearchaeota archaeon]